MGERKGTNHYYPPDYDPSKGGLNKFLGTHALRERARKLHLGILIIRFEMPYNIWCDGCGNHIGMGVRYNAEKTKVGMYYSTPVYQFRMKCHLCDNHFEIKTDPGNLDYLIVSGARRQENRWDPTQNGQIVPDDKNVQKRLFDDAMFKLEHGEKDKDHAKTVAPALSRLATQREERWRDDYTANCILRAKFRVKRRELKAKEEKDKAILAKSSLDIKLLPETEEDRKMAALLSLAPSKSMNERKCLTREEIINRPALPSCSGNTTTFMGVRAAKHLEKNITKNCLGILTKSKTIFKKKKNKFSIEACKAYDGENSCVVNFDDYVNGINGSDKMSGSPSSSISSPENSSKSLNSCAKTAESNADVDLVEDEAESTAVDSKNVSLVSGDYDFSSSDENV